MSSALILNPYDPITANGCHITVRHGNKRFTVRLFRGEKHLATTTASRSGDCTPVEAVRRAELGLWGPKSSFYAAIELLAAIAANKNI